jgi:hypothetical protein
MESYLISFLEPYVSIASKCRFICISIITMCVHVCVCARVCANALVFVSEKDIVFMVPFHNPVGRPEIFNFWFRHAPHV